MMVLRARLPVYRSQMVQMIELPYGDGFFTMTLLMPGDEDDSMEEFIEETLTEENVSFWLAELSEAEVELHMPRFDVEHTLDLKEVLEEMGMERPFERSADFYYVSDEKRVYLNEFRHKSFVTVQEHGLEEAEVLSTDTPPVISYNRPFVYLIRQQQTGAILFMGLMNDPGG
jgi:serpin B